MIIFSILLEFIFENQKLINLSKWRWIEW